MRSRAAGSSHGPAPTAAFAVAWAVDVVAGRAIVTRAIRQRPAQQRVRPVAEAGLAELTRKGPTEEAALAERPHREDAEAEVGGQRQDPPFRTRPRAG